MIPIMISSFLLLTKYVAFTNVLVNLLGGIYAKKYFDTNKRKFEKLM